MLNYKTILINELVVRMLGTESIIMYDYLLTIAFLHKSHEDQIPNNKIQPEREINFQYFRHKEFSHVQNKVINECSNTKIH